MSLKKEKKLKIRSCYLDPVYDPKTLIKICQKISSILKDEMPKFDTLVGRGNSGALVISPLAHSLQIPFGIVRKNDSSHYDDKKLYEGCVPEKYVIIDDKISTGTTVRSILREVGKRNKNAKCVGLILYLDWFGYQNDYFIKFKKEIPSLLEKNIHVFDVRDKE